MSSRADQIMEEIKTPVEKKNFPLTDSGNAEMIASLYGDKIRYDRRRVRWHVWNPPIWKPEPDDAGVGQFAKEAARRRQYDALSIENSRDKTDAVKWGLLSENAQKINAALDLVRGEEPVSDEGDTWDSDPWLFACQNGVIDLRTGEIREGKPEDKITMISPVKFDPSATRERWEQFLDEVFEGNKELIHYFHKALGYSMTGDLREQSVFVNHGQGGNGKSKLFDAVRYVMGTYAKEAEPLTFYKSFNRSNDFDLPALEGKRLITIAENAEASTLDTQRIKRFSGGDPITAAAKHKNAVTFNGTGKLWMYFNNKPQVNDNTASIWSRLKLIPFNVEFRNTPREDKHLPEKLRAESEGILAWLVEGCLLWQTEGLNPVPQIVSTGVDEYERDNDWLADFLYQRTKDVDNKSTYSSDAYKAYVSWAEGEGLQKREVKSQKEFSKRMKEKYGTNHTRKGTEFCGLELVSVTDVTDEKDSSSLGVTAKAPFYTFSREETSIENNGKNTLLLSHRRENPSQPVTKDVIAEKIENHEIPPDLL